jgi:hypothetical protein
MVRNGGQNLTMFTLCETVKRFFDTVASTGIGLQRHSRCGLRRGTLECIHTLSKAINRSHHFSMIAVHRLSQRIEPCHD